MIRELDRAAMGERIKEERRAKGISQVAFAKKLGITQTHLSNLETGKSGLTLSSLIMLANEFDCSVDYLLFGIKNNTNKVADDGYEYSEREINMAIRIIEAIKAK